MASSRDREAWAQIFKLYKSLPHLWDKNNINYGNRSMMTDGYKLLTRAYRMDLDRQASVGAFRMKMKNLRTTYYRELRKIRLCKQKGEKYTPSLWYFENLNFLGNSKLRETPTVTSEPEKNKNSTHADDLLQVEDSIQIDDDSDIEVDLGPSTSQPKIIKKHEPQKKSNPREHLTDATETKTMKDEHWEVIGKSIGYQLRELQKGQFTIVSKLISDAIYFGRLNKLTEASHIDIGTQFVDSNSEPPHYNTYEYVSSEHHNPGLPTVDVLNTQRQSASLKLEGESEEEEE